MPGRTPLDSALNSKNTFLAFTGIVTAVAAWSIWGTDMFPGQSDPTGDPSKWTEPELRQWLNSVCPPFLVLFSIFCWFKIVLRSRHFSVNPGGKQAMLGK